MRRDSEPKTLFIRRCPQFTAQLQHKQKDPRKQICRARWILSFYPTNFPIVAEMTEKMPFCENAERIFLETLLCQLDLLDLNISFLFILYLWYYINFSLNQTVFFSAISKIGFFWGYFWSNPIFKLLSHVSQQKTLYAYQRNVTYHFYFCRCSQMQRKPTRVKNSGQSVSYVTSGPLA